MTVDPNTVPSIPVTEERRTSTESQPVPHAPDASKSATGMWLLRMRALIFVTVCATFGILLIILPWTPKWTDNPLFLTMPELRPILSNGFVRGLCSGLGMLDVWLGFREAIYYHEHPVASDQ